MVSVIIPVYNKAPHLNRSIDSVLNQTFSDFELILIDDASTDESLGVLKSYSDSRIKILERESPGAGGYAARNLGVKEANHEWVSFLDADDEWELDYLESVVTVLKKFRHVEVISTNWDSRYNDRDVPNDYFNIFTELYLEFGLNDFFRQNYFIWTSAVTIRKTLLLDVGSFPECRCKRGGDVDTWIRCLEKSQQNIWINKKLAHYYKETVNRVTDNSSNPVIGICSIESIDKIRRKSNDRKLMRSIDFFLAKVIYNKMISDYRRGEKYYFRDLNHIQQKTVRLKILFKYLLRVVLIEK